MTNERILSEYIPPQGLFLFMLRNRHS